MLSAVPVTCNSASMRKGQEKSHRMPFKAIRHTFMERGIENSAVSDNPSVDTVGSGKAPESSLNGLLACSCSLAARLAISSCPADNLGLEVRFPKEGKGAQFLTVWGELRIRCMAQRQQMCSTDSISKVSASVLCS